MACRRMEAHFSPEISGNSGHTTAGGAPAAPVGFDDTDFVTALSERQRRNSNDMLCGWGGAGAYSDGKLTLSSEVGGLLGEYLEPDSLDQILQTADDIWIKHGAPEVIFGEASPKLEDLADRARLANLNLIG